MIVKWSIVAAYSDIKMYEGEIEIDDNASDNEIQEAVEKESAHCVIWERQTLRSDGWFDAGGGKLDPTHNIWEKAELGCRKRLDTFVEGFSLIQGIDEDGIPYLFDAIRVMKYFDADGNEIPNTMELLPWYNGSEVRNVEIPQELKEQAMEVLPAITFQATSYEPDDEETKPLWMRMGCTINLTDKEIEQLKEDPQKLISELLKTGRIIPDGETYFPDEDKENASALGEYLEFDM